MNELSFTQYSRIIDLKSDEYWKRMPWIENDPLRQIVSGNCHWGQLKLFYTELEFINICMERKYDLNKSVMIYVGAAPGTHIIYLHRLFPNLHWILFDPNEFHITKNDYVDIFTGKDGFFKDDMIPDLLNHPFIKKYPIKLFISDIRTNPNEKTVFDEMLDQQRWLLKLGADMSMLKFRLPYTLPGENALWVYDLTTIKDYIKKPIGRPCKTKEYNVCYLKGDIYVQVYPPQYSTETRLIVDKKKDKYQLYNYDTVMYEEKCYYYNIHIRNEKMMYVNSEELKKHILGCDDNYETCSEYKIIEQYFTVNKLNINWESICKMMYEIRNFHNDNISTRILGQLFNKSLALCKMFTIYKEKFPTYEKFVLRIEKKALNTEQVKKLFDSITQIYKSNNEHNKYQMDCFNNGTLFSKSYYLTQIQLAMDGIKANNIIYKAITDMYHKYLLTQ